MLNRNYFSNLPSKNIIREDKTKNLSKELFFNSKDSDNFKDFRFSEHKLTLFSHANI